MLDEGFQLQIATPRWSVPLLGDKRYKGAKGGRSSGKSHFMAEGIVECHVIDPNHSTVCIREVQKSLKFSAKRLIEDKIEALGVGHLFDVQATEIHNVQGKGVIIFQGMQDHTADSVKSLESFDKAWCEEAQSLSHRSIELLDPTMRKDGAELWFSWNPRFPDDAVEQLFEDNDDAILVHVNYTDNPFCPESVGPLAERQKERDFEKYLHIWQGGYQTNSESRVIKKWEVKELPEPEDAVWFYGVDWGFSVDPTAGIRLCQIDDNTLYFTHEVYEVGVEMERLPILLNGLPGFKDWPSRSDSARPETIDYVRRNGCPRVRAATKGKGSVEHGLEYINSMDLYVHPRCVNLIHEFKRYSYKIDKQTDEVLPKLEDANNHLVDAVRYAVEKLHRRGTKIKTTKKSRPRERDYGRNDEGGSNWKTA